MIVAGIYIFMYKKCGGHRNVARHAYEGDLNAEGSMSNGTEIDESVDGQCWLGGT